MVNSALLGAGPVRAGVNGNTNVLVFAAGAEVGALATAMVLLVANGLLSIVGIPANVALGLVVAAAVFALLRDGGVVRVDQLTFHRQVERRVLSHYARWGLFQFGAELGTGVRTNLVATTPYVLALALVLVPTGVWPFVAAATGFALARAIPFAYRAFSVTRGRNRVARMGTARADLLVSGMIVLGAVLLMVLRLNDVVG